MAIQSVYKLLDGVAGNTTGASFRIPLVENREFLLVQYDLDGATGSFELQGKLDTGLAWVTLEAAIVADDIISYDAVPIMRAILSGYTGPGNPSVFVKNPA